MELASIMAWIVAANTIITFATTAYNLLSARATKALEAIRGLEGKIETLNKKLDEKIDELAAERQTHGSVVMGRFQLVENRLLKIEADLEHMPDRDQAQKAQEQAHRLELAIAKLTGSLETLDERLTGRMDTLDERIKPVAAATARIQNLLVEQGAEK